MYEGIVYGLVFLAAKYGEKAIDVISDVIGTVVNATIASGLDIYQRRKEYLHEREETSPVRSVQEERGAQTSVDSSRT